MKEEKTENLLNKIQKELKAPNNQRNSFGNYNYRSCEDILEAVKPLLGSGTLTLGDEPVLVGERVYIKATATLVSGQDKWTISAYARESLSKKGMDEAQITGACSSYARKYALNGLFLIDDTKDQDTMDNRTTGQIDPSNAKPSVTDKMRSYKVDINGPDVREPFVTEKEKKERAEALDTLRIALRARGAKNLKDALAIINPAIEKEGSLPWDSLEGKTKFQYDEAIKLVSQKNG
jgi:hypothetical protein